MEEYEFHLWFNESILYFTVILGVGAEQAIDSAVAAAGEGVMIGMVVTGTVAVDGVMTAIMTAGTTVTMTGGTVADTMTDAAVIMIATVAIGKG